MIRVGGENSPHNRYGKLKADNLNEFVSPFLKDENENDIVTVNQREPSKKSRVYLVRDESSLTGRNYVYCSGCQHRSFKKFRSVNCASAPEHLKKYGSSDNEVLKFCRKCWFNTDDTITEKHENKITPSPCFERSSLGITDRRACFGWHFIQRDFVRQKFEDKDNAVDNEEAILLPLATVVVQNGSDFTEKRDSGNLFDFNGRETSLSTYNASQTEVDLCVESARPSTEFLRNKQEQQIKSEKKLLEIVNQIRKDHDYAPTIQKEIEVMTSALSPEKTIGVNMKYFSGSSHNNGDLRVRNNHLKIDKNGQRLKNFAKNLVKKAVEFENYSTRNIEITMPVQKTQDEIKKIREKGEAIDPALLVGLKATSKDGQTLPGLICPLCGVHTVKSYSVWRKNNAPDKIQGLFKDGITVIRACRKCVPYPVNREKEKSKNSRHNNSRQKSKNNPAPLRITQNDVKLKINEKYASTQNNNNNIKDRRSLEKKKNTSSGNSLGVKIESLKDYNGFSIAKGQVIPTKGEVVKVKGEVVKVKGEIATKVKDETTKVKTAFTRVKGEKIQFKVQLIENSETKRKYSADLTVDENDDVILKKAKLEEEKRKLQLASGQDLTGLECFEMLDSEETIEHESIKHAKENSNSSSCDVKSFERTDHDDNCSSYPSRGRPSKSSLVCSQCNSPLDKSYRTLTMAKCPKRLLSLFDNDLPRKTIKLCRKCLK